MVTCLTYEGGFGGEGGELDTGGGASMEQNDQGRGRKVLAAMA